MRGARMAPESSASIRPICPQAIRPWDRCRSVLPSGAVGGDAAAVNLHGLDGLSPQLLLLIVPLVILQIGLLAFAIVDLLRDDRAVRGGSKPAWAVVIVFVNLIGPIIYFLVGRVDAPVEPGAEPRGVPGWGSPHDPPIAAPAPPLVPARRRLPRRRRLR